MKKFWNFIQNEDTSETELLFNGLFQKIPGGAMRSHLPFSVTNFQK